MKEIVLGLILISTNLMASEICTYKKLPAPKDMDLVWYLLKCTDSQYVKELKEKEFLNEIFDVETLETTGFTFTDRNLVLKELYSAGYVQIACDGDFLKP